MYIYLTDYPEEVGKRPPSGNSPRFVCFTDDNAELTYFVYVEQTVLCQVSTFVKALIIWFVSHCNMLSVQKMQLFSVFMLLQAGAKTSTYLSLSSDIMTFVRE